MTTKTINYSHVFGNFSNTTLALINACQYIQKDERGEFVWNAVTYDSNGNVTFEKKYKEVIKPA